MPASFGDPQGGSLGCHGIVNAGQKIIQSADQQRVTGAANADRAIARQCRPFQLHRVGAGGPAHARDPDGPVRHGFEQTVCRIEHPARLHMDTRAGVLMQAVIGDGRGGAAPLGCGRLQHHAAGVHGHMQTIVAFWDRGGRTAFEHLSGIPGGCGRQPRASPPRPKVRDRSTGPPATSAAPSRRWRRGSGPIIATTRSEFSSAPRTAPGHR